MKLDVHHIGVVVDDIDKGKAVYETVFGMKEVARFTVDAFKAEVCFIPANNTYIELVQPLSDDGLGHFLKKHGSGTLHHIGYLVEDIDEACRHFIEEKGLRSVTGGPQRVPCFENALFFHPKDTGNVLIELVSGATCPLPGGGRTAAG
ncbi:MAG: VOC family protein [Deltaproteobacteria bacterium]|nr:VOC family protein [Deltaproteobacteria bacterium]